MTGADFLIKSNISNILLDKTRLAQTFLINRIILTVAGKDIEKNDDHAELEKNISNY